MVLMQVNAREDISRKLEHYKIDRGFKTKAQALIDIAEVYFKDNPDFFTEGKK